VASEEFNVDIDARSKPTNSAAILPKAPAAGLTVLIGYVVVLLFTVWLARAHRIEIPDAAVLAMICFSFGWVYLALWKLDRGRRRLGWNRSNMTKLLTGSRPDDPDELFIWQWTLQLCFAIVSVVLCVVALTFAVS
jgi:protein-S-isoprenylcysteine O-methyltransferase Ste14